MAFQPMLDLRHGGVFGYEALLRGKGGLGAHQVMSQVDDGNRYAFDQLCRVTALREATALDLARDGAMLSINFLPNAIYEPRACIRLTLETAEQTGFPPEQIMFEFIETESLDTDHLLNILETYRDLGFMTAIDDFGAGYSGLELLARFQPDVIKLDMSLVRGVDRSTVKQKILRNLVNMLDDLGVRALCEGIETQAECDVVADMGVELVQGYLFAKPQIDALPIPFWPTSRVA